MDCEMCKEKEAKYIITNKWNYNKLKICTDCKAWFEKRPIEEVKT